MNHFSPLPPLIHTPAHRDCRVTVIIPARNEERALPAALEALRVQRNGQDDPLNRHLYEIIVLLNNCHDASAMAVRIYQAQHPTLQLHVVERTLPLEIAHVGTARRMLMDTAFQRLQHHPAAAILSTDADTVVAPDWIERNLHALDSGADAVGGVIHLHPDDIAQLDPGTLQAYLQDRRYQCNVARLESLLDPDPADPWPRHLEHFGASLACTPQIYALAGGLPPVKPLEDVAFVNALRRVGARLRHSPEVSIVTSARLEGRAEVGLSGQLRRWQQDSASHRPHLVQNAAYLTHRFTSLGQLRQVWSLTTLPSLASYPRCWRGILSEAHSQKLTQTDFLAVIDCDRLIDETFRGSREGRIHRVISDLSRAINRATAAPTHPAETSPAASIAQYATQPG